MLAPAAPFGKSRKTAESTAQWFRMTSHSSAASGARNDQLFLRHEIDLASDEQRAVFSTVLTASDAAAFCSEAFEPEFSEAVGRQFEGANAIGAGRGPFHNTERIADHAGHILDQRRVDLLPMFDELLERFDPTCEREPK